MTDVAPMWDRDVEDVVAALLEMDPEGERFARVIRATFDQLYDGQRTGRYTWESLSRTERAHFGSILEINLQREFDFEDGDDLDFKIAGRDIDCKFSERGRWMIPPITLDKLALLVTAVDTSASFDVGIVRISNEILTQKPNWDRKVTISASGKNFVRWVFKNHPFPPNVLGQIDPGEVSRIQSLSSGQRRLAELFRVASGRRINGTVVATIAQQKDFMRRARDGGGSRNLLRREGYLIIGGDYKVHAEVARALGAEVPTKGEMVSVRVVPADTDGPGTVELEGQRWRQAAPHEASMTPAPLLPEIKRRPTS